MGRFISMDFSIDVSIHSTAKLLIFQSSGQWGHRLQLAQTSADKRSMIQGGEINLLD